MLENDFMKTQNHHSQNENSIKKVEEEAQALLEATADAAEDTVIEARERFKAALAATKDVYGRVKDRTIEGAKATDKAIRANPYQALGIAFGLGAVVGFLLTRRGRD